MNPFNPSFGKVPNIFLDRNRLVHTVVNNLDDPNSPYQTTLVYGLRGVGKTSFLTDVSKEVTTKENWIVVNLVSNQNMLADLVEGIYRKSTPKIQKFLSKIDEIKVAGLGIELTSKRTPIKEHISKYTLEAVLEELKSKGIKLLVTLDEVTSTPEIREFASIYQLMIREDFNISLIMTGLPEQVSELQNDKVLTFLLRSKRITLSPLNKLDIKYRYKEVFKSKDRNITDQVLNRMTTMTNGYAYAFQLLGYLLWQTESKEITDNTIDSILDEYKEELYRNVYGKIYSELSEVDRKFLAAMVDENYTPISEIEKKMNKSHNYVSIYRRRLLDAQIIISPQRGAVAFTLPFFKDFIVENGSLYE